MGKDMKTPGLVHFRPRGECLCRTLCGAVVEDGWRDIAEDEWHAKQETKARRYTGDLDHEPTCPACRVLMPSYLKARLQKEETMRAYLDQRITSVRKALLLYGDS